MKWRNAVPIARHLSGLAETDPERFAQEWEAHREELEQAGVACASFLRLRLMFQRRFVLARLALELLVVPLWECKTTDVTSSGLWRFNPIWLLMTVDRDEKAGEFIVAHEVLHWALRHCDPRRAQGRQKDIWNLAVDHVVNLFLQRLGLQVPPGAVLFRQWAHERLSAEEVYNRLTRQLKHGGMPAGALEPGGPTWDERIMRMAGRVLTGTDIPLRPIDEHGAWEEIEPTIEAQARLQAAAKAAQEFARRIGKSPGVWAEVFAGLLGECRLDWGTLLYLYAQETLEVKPYPVRWPDQRYVQQDIIIPDTRSDPTPVVVAAADTSGSISPKDFAAALGHLAPLLAATGAETRVLLFDAAVQWEGLYNPQLETPHEFVHRIPFKGRGGTNFTPIFEWIQRNCFERPPDLVVILTDGYGDNWASAPDYPVLWVLTPDGRQEQAFGDILLMR